MYNPLSIFSTPCMLLVPTTKKFEGVHYKEFEEGEMFFCSFKSYGGTNLKGAEKSSGEILVILDTANIECFYNPNINGTCRIKNLINDGIYEIINEPEDVEQRHKLLKFKVQRLKNG